MWEEYDFSHPDQNLTTLSNVTLAQINGVSLAATPEPDRPSTSSTATLQSIHVGSQVAALSWKHRVITFDLRGYGASEVPAT